MLVSAAGKAGSRIGDASIGQAQHHFVELPAHSVSRKRIANRAIEQFNPEQAAEWPSIESSHVAVRVDDVRTKISKNEEEPPEHAEVPTKTSQEVHQGHLRPLN